MKRVTITTIRGNKYTGDWNTKFYDYKDAGTYRIYLYNVEGEEDGLCYIVDENEKERVIKELSSNKIEEDNKRICIIKQEFDKLDREAKQLLLEYLQHKI